MVQDLFWYSAYALCSIGAISFGYLAIRFSYPDVRAMPWSSKLGFSLILGLVFFAPSIALSVLWLREAFFAGFPIAAFLTALVFEVKSLALPAKTMTVALPVITVNPEAGGGTAPALPAYAAGEEEISKAAASILKTKRAPPSIEERYCGSCGAQMRGEDEFCGNCGAKL
ncbi:zinc ribbon domain-containing protein [Candidatus Micrarchaeota archaeon]|nr:zinc ribbon domain-containing protein [Candidatus Micrarchaeota archaeon]